jgi:acyl-CoA synthetase (AMP-forming)/AMP-acid ligase II
VGLLTGVTDVTLFDVLRRHAERDPDRIWLTFERDDGEARSWSYAEFADEVERTAVRLAELGLSRGSTFAISLDNHPEMIRLI